MSRELLERDPLAYARLAVELADPRVDRRAVLQRHGLDEDAWEAIDDLWQRRLEDDVDMVPEAEEAVPPLLARVSEAFTRAQRERASAVVLPFARFVEATRELRRGQDMSTVLRRLQLGLDDYLAAQRHWTAEMLRDPALAAEMERALSR